MTHFAYHSALVLIVTTAVTAGSRSEMAAHPSPANSQFSYGWSEVGRTQEGSTAAEVKSQLRRMESLREMTFTGMGKGAPLLPAAPALGAMVPEYQRALSTMLDAFAAESRGQATNRGQEAAIAAVRIDLVRLQGMRGGQFERFLPAHSMRVKRLIALQQGR